MDHTECLQSDFIPWHSLGAAEETVLLPAVALAVPMEDNSAMAVIFGTFSELHVHH